MVITRTRTFLGAAVALTACLFAWACESSGGGGECFPPEHGPDGPSCVGFDLGVTCPVSIGPYYTCKCKQSDASGDAGPPQTWVCAMTGAGGGLGAGGSGVGGHGVGGGGAGGGMAGPGGAGGAGGTDGGADGGK